jgi:uncharacterized RDD family membrane protein YckC
MKCPKCNYIGFEPSDRCRNCGFDFSLAPPAPADPELLIRPAEPAGPLADFDLGDARRPARATPQTRAARRRQDPSLDPGLSGTPQPTPSAADLPLFGELPPDDAPLVLPASAPPLSVRRSTPAPTRRAAVTPRPAERAPDVSLPLGGAQWTSQAAEPAPPAEVAADGDLAALGPRFLAAAIDWLMLSGLDLAVVYFTLRVSRLTTGEVLMLPPAPLLGFLLLLNGGYLALFTAASGQTIGKMAFGLKVVSGSEVPLTVGRAVVRAIAFLLSAVPAGLGLVPAAFDGARRGLHDRLADTRVVRAQAS